MTRFRDQAGGKVWQQETQVDPTLDDRVCAWGVWTWPKGTRYPDVSAERVATGGDWESGDEVRVTLFIAPVPLPPAIQLFRAGPGSVVCAARRRHQIALASTVAI